MAAVGLLLPGFASRGLAEVKLTDAFSVGGFVSESYQRTDFRPGPSADHFGLDDAFLRFQAASDPVSAVTSLYHLPDAVPETALLDAYVTYDLGRGLSLTGGKFQTYLGYEEFFAVDNPAITYGNGDVYDPIPAYHSGLRVDYESVRWVVGAALLDSLYPAGTGSAGDGELRHNQGYEGFVSFQGIPKMVLTGGVGYEGGGGPANAAVLYDFWATYQLTASTLLVADWTKKDGGTGDRGKTWLVRVEHDLTDRVSLAARVSGDQVDGGPGCARNTFVAALKVTPQLTLRAEYTRTNFRGSAVDRASFGAIQAYLKF